MKRVNFIVNGGITFDKAQVFVNKNPDLDVTNLFHSINNMKLFSV